VADSDAHSNSLSLLEPGRNCWRVEEAGRASLIVDAADYYRHAMEAMLEARSQILLIGWDVDTRVRLVDGKHESGAPTTLGGFVTWLANNRPGLCIHILCWDEGMLHLPGRGTTLLRMARWAFDSRINLKWDSRHPLDASHHQKILVIDDRVAFCGGIDITGSRWDTRRHCDDEPGRRRPFTRRSYEPWHDATMAVDGKAAEALGDLARIRWEAADGTTLPCPPRSDHDPWPTALEPVFRDVSLGIARTRGKDGAIEEVREIEALFVELIERAKRQVYVETQYFASRVIAEAIAARLDEPDGPEFVIVNPRHAWGWLDETVMSPARYELVKALKERDRHGRFAIYAPVTQRGADIYVHAKLMFVDDVYLRVGSANMNNRSMGLDSECDLLLDGSGRESVRRRIARLRCDILAEHFATDAPSVARRIEERGSLIAAIESLRNGGRSLVPLEDEKPGKLKRALAKSEVLDPEGPRELFEPRMRPGLLSRLRRRRRG
jgi:phospholipase D1/2